MTNGILLAFAAAVIYGLLGISLEIAGKRSYPIWLFNLFKMLTGFLLGLAATLILKLPLFVPKLFWLGLVGALTFPVTTAAYLKASRERNIATNWTILNLSVVLPILFSVWWFGDAFSWTKGVGIVFTILAILLIGGGFHDITLRSLKGGWLGWISIAFLLNGWLVVMFRFVPSNLGPLFTLYFYGLSVLLVLPIQLATRTSWRPTKGLVGMAAISALTHWCGIILTILALAAVAKVSNQAGLIVYPITNGLVIPAGVVLGVILLKQRVGLRVSLGVLCGMAALGILSLS
jgi:drug/metabolite transporter (DMT)-like permease